MPEWLKSILLDMGITNPEEVIEVSIDWKINYGKPEVFVKMLPEMGEDKDKSEVSRLRPERDLSRRGW